MGASCTGTQHSPDPSTKLATRRSRVSHSHWCAFVKMAQGAQLTDMDSYMDNPQIRTAKVKYAINSRVREGGFTPYLFIIGRDPSIPTSLLQEPLRAQNAAVHNEHARRAEEIRRVVEIAATEIDASKSCAVLSCIKYDLFVDLVSRDNFA